LTVQAIFGLQFILSILAWALIAKWYFSPHLDKMPLDDALSLLALPHIFRHVGLVFLVPGIVAQPLQSDFGNPAAYGDLLTGILALLAFASLRMKWSGAIAIVWLFNIVGTLDLMNALRQADVIPNFGAAWYIPTFLVPLLLVTHFMMFKRLIKQKR
jgi:hypothetical protein